MLETRVPRVFSYRSRPDMADISASISRPTSDLRCISYVLVVTDCAVFSACTILFCNVTRADERDGIPQTPSVKRLLKILMPEGMPIRARVSKVPKELLSCTLAEDLQEDMMKLFLGQAMAWIKFAIGYYHVCPLHDHHLKPNWVPVEFMLISTVDNVDLFTSFYLTISVSTLASTIHVAQDKRRSPRSRRLLSRSCYATSKTSTSQVGITNNPGAKARNLPSWGENFA